ncbi:glycosyltransferase family 2 protein [Dyadobacter sp.]|uniref:glycosyltransferase family 2 protein n=1 Tax=Dyadobacter sp. TaxID=1914288 RepID=UPI003F7289FF
MQSAELDLTIAIPAKNEEKNLANCLNAIGRGFAKEIVLIDSNSTDNTRLIAREFGVRTIEFNWDGNFPKKRNWYLRNHTPTTKWILFLDADEYLTEEFKTELRHKLTNEDNVGYWLRYTIYFLGKELKGGYPLDKLALFQVGKGEYERIDESQWSQMDMEIHEHPILEGPVGRIKSKIDHQDLRGVSHYVKKHDEYSSWEAARFLKIADNKALFQSFTWRQRLKYKLMNTPLLGPLFFLGGFFLLRGFLDGARGFTFAILKASYFVQIYCKIQEFKASSSKTKPSKALE